MGINTKVKIGNLIMKNPVTVGSGTFAFGQEMAEFFDISRLGAITVKGVSAVPWIGNEYPRTVETASGMLNAIGLENPGIDVFLSDKLPFLRNFDVPIIVNIVGHSIDEYAEVAEKLDGVEGINALEINISCPNVQEGCLAFGSSAEGATSVVKVVRKKTNLTIITKLSPNVGNITEIAKAAVGAGSDGLSLINTLIGTAIDPWKRKFRLANKTGGLSGPAVKPVALRMVYEVAKAVDVPIIGMGGIINWMDAIEFILAGATVVSVGTGTFINPLTAIEVIDGIESYMQKMGIDDVNELRGSVN
jgi:dihydroorotate dehydrogenase (NAD+) catalytic subunit